MHNYKRQIFWTASHHVQGRIIQIRTENDCAQLLAIEIGGRTMNPKLSHAARPSYDG